MAGCKNLKLRKQLVKSRDLFLDGLDFLVDIPNHQMMHYRSCETVTKMHNVLK